MRIGIFAPCSVVPTLELDQGVEFLKKSGFEVKIHPQVKKRHLFFAGRDEERVSAFWELAWDQEVDALWCARGGYGALRVLRLIQERSDREGKPPQKLLIGSSDVTALHDFVRSDWGWSTLHAPMPGLLKFLKMSRTETRSLFGLIKGEPLQNPWGSIRLRFFGPKPNGPIEGEVIGGNLSLIVARLGTPFAPMAKDRILFLEDVGETLSRLDRCLSQLELAGTLSGVKAIVLGDFLACEDKVPEVLVKKPKKLGPLRRSFSQREAFKEIFGELSSRLGVPVAFGLPVGHGPGMSCLPLYSRCKLTPEGSFSVVDWDWRLR